MWSSICRENWASLIQSVSPEQELREPLIDTQLADHTIEVLRELSITGDPFFLGLGLRKPHIPFTYPERFADLYGDVGMPQGANG